MDTPATKPGSALSSPTDLLRALPHGEPFRFVTSLVDIVPGASAAGLWAVSGEEDFLRGHFPGRPLVPGVLVAEALAQISGIALLARDQGLGQAPADARAHARLAQVNVKFHAGVVPPATLRLVSTLLKQFEGLALFEVRADVIDAEGHDTLVAASGTIVLAFGSASVSSVPSSRP